MKLYEYVLKVTDGFSSPLKKLSEGSKKSSADLKKVDDQAKKVAKSGSALQSVLGKIGPSLIATFSAGALMGFMNKVIEVRGEFQKYEAVLTNTLGSKSAAQRDMYMLQDLAQKTNFGVIELTDNYVKLVNRGIKPNSKELMKLADVANSTGKTYNQYVEAILDAQTGEFERLKEFGILAHKHGDKVKFTFKGVTKEVKLTDKAIADYMIGLGELQGVAGSTEAISKTLSGQVSNLGDAFDRLFNVIGSKSDSVLSKAISGFSTLINRVSDLLMLEEEYIKKEISPTVSKYVEGYTKGFEELASAAKKSNMNVAKELEKSFQSNSNALKRQIDEAQAKLNDFDKNNKKGFFGTGVASGIFGLPEEQEKKRTQLLTNLVFAQEKLSAQTDAYRFATEQKKSGPSAKKGIDETIKGGAKATTVNISINKMIEKIAENMSFASTKEGASSMEEAALDALNRVINGAVYTARQ